MIRLLNVLIKALESLKFNKDVNRFNDSIDEPNIIKISNLNELIEYINS